MNRHLEEVIKRSIADNSYKETSVAAPVVIRQQGVTVVDRGDNGLEFLDPEGRHVGHIPAKDEYLLLQMLISKRFTLVDRRNSLEANKQDMDLLNRF